MAFAWDTPAGPVSVEVALPAGHRPGRTPALVLAHGAGSDFRHPSLVGLASAVTRAGITTCRFNFPYREAGRRIPDRLPVLTACYRAVVDRLRSDAGIGASWIAIGGRSLGGRVASHVALAGAPVRGLLFLAFPLHPAGRPGTERAVHLGGIAARMLFVQGTRDALARWPLLERTVATLPNATLHAVPDADHALAVPKRERAPEAVTAEIQATVIAWLATLGN